MAHIRVVCDGGGEYGFGNLRRSTTLAASLRTSGYRVSVDAMSPEAQRLLPDSPKEDGPGDIWLLDLPYEGDAWVRKARASKSPVAALDFIGSEPPDLDISIFDHGHAPAMPNRLIGLQYAIIRPEISALAPAAAGEGVVVIIGGGDANGLGERIAERVHADGNETTLIEGPLAKKSRELPAKIKRLSSPPDLAQHMAACLWGVTSGGGTMLEMMCLGKAIYVVPRTPSEISLAQFILAQGALLGVGLDRIDRPSVEMRRGVEMIARRLVDGQGSARIAAALQTLL